MLRGCGRRPFRLLRMLFEKGVECDDEAFKTILDATDDEETREEAISLARIAGGLGRCSGLAGLRVLGGQPKKVTIGSAVLLREVESPGHGPPKHGKAPPPGFGGAEVVSGLLKDRLTGGIVNRVSSDTVDVFVAWRGQPGAKGEADFVGFKDGGVTVKHAKLGSGEVLEVEEVPLEFEGRVDKAKELLAKADVVSLRARILWSMLTPENRDKLSQAVASEEGKVSIKESDSYKRFKIHSFCGVFPQLNSSSRDDNGDRVLDIVRSDSIPDFESCTVPLGDDIEEVVMSLRASIALLAGEGDQVALNEFQSLLEVAALEIDGGTETEKGKKIDLTLGDVGKLEDSWVSTMAKLAKARRKLEALKELEPELEPESVKNEEEKVRVEVACERSIPLLLLTLVFLVSGRGGQD